MVSGEPGDQRLDVPTVLPGDVLAVSVGVELNLELPEGVLELHAGHAAMVRPDASSRIRAVPLQQHAVRAGVTLGRRSWGLLAD